MVIRGDTVRKKCFIAVVAAALLLGTANAAAWDGTAIRMNDWARAGVQSAYESGAVRETLFPVQDYTQPITREQFTTLLVDLIAQVRGLDARTLAEQLGVFVAADNCGETSCLDDALTAAGRFADTQSAYVEVAARLGLVQGDEWQQFHPEQPVLREEAAVMMQNCMAVLGITEANQMPVSYTDVYLIPRWSIQAVRFVSGRTDRMGQPLMGGGEGRFDAGQALTIEQAILSAGRMLDSVQVTGYVEGWQQAPGYDTVTLALTFGGDCTLGRNRGSAYGGSLDEMYDRKGAAYFFSGISEFFTDDLTMVNFEGTLTNSTAGAQKTFVFRGRPAYADILKAGSIDVVTVANNHSADYGSTGFADTLRYLSNVVQVSGYEHMPIVTVKGVRIGFASQVGWTFDSTQKRWIERAVHSLRDRGANIIVFNYHWGIERAYHSNETQRAIAHYCIDQGADLVIGHHPHVVQEVETYKGKQIAYSLGNLVFGGNRNPSDKRCLIFRQNFTVNLDTKKIQSSTYQALPYQVTSTAGKNDYRPQPRANISG